MKVFTLPPVDVLPSVAPDDPIAATRRTGRTNCNRDAPKVAAEERLARQVVQRSEVVAREDIFDVLPIRAEQADFGSKLSLEHSGISMKLKELRFPG